MTSITMFSVVNKDQNVFIIIEQDIYIYCRITNFIQIFNLGSNTIVCKLRKFISVRKLHTNKFPLINFLNAVSFITH